MIALLLWGAHAAELSGTVVDADGEPVTGVYAIAYDPRFGYAYDLTDATGAFSIATEADVYRVRILPQSGINLSETWYEDTFDYCAAELLDARAADVSGIEVALVDGGAITGVLVDGDGAPIVDASVMAHSLFAESIAEDRADLTDETGAFAIVGLVAEDNGVGLYVIEVAVQGWPRQYLGGVYSSTVAETVEIEAGETVDLGTRALLDGITLGGAVTGPDGPVGSGTAYAYSPSQVVTVEIEDGRYLAFGLPPGEALAWASSEGLATTYYPSSDRPGDRVEVLEEGELYDALDIDMPYEATFRGRIVADLDLSGVSVLAYNDSKTVGIGAGVAEDGSFEVHGLFGGDYTLMVYGANDGLVTDFVRDAAGEPVVFTLDDAEASPVYEVVVPRGGVLEGTVTDAYTGEPVYGATIVASGLDSGKSLAAETDREGAYQIVGLVEDEWEVRAQFDPYCTTDASWVTVFHDAEIDPDRAATVLVAAGETLIWDVAMPPDDDHDQMDDEWEREHGLDPGADDSGADPDGDGASNLEEYRAGTDPLTIDEVEEGCGCRSRSAASLFPLLLAVRRRRATQVR